MTMLDDAVDYHTSVARERMKQLNAYADTFLERKDRILTGFTAAARIQRARERILHVLGATEEQWNDWRWQMHHRHFKLETLEKIIPLSAQEREVFQRARQDSLVAISPYFLSLIDPEDPYCPIRLQVLPHADEYADQGGDLDPSGEAYSSPVPGWVQRYPDRGIILVNDIGACAVACRFCQRRHNMSPKEPEHHSAMNIQSALNYIREHRGIRDVLLTGGDALALSNSKLEWILSELRTIPHVEIIRLASRLPITLPQRVTPELCEMLGKYGMPGGYGAIWVVTHANHPIEITPDVQKACLRLMGQGMPIINQSVLLKGINDQPAIMMCLNQELVRVGIKPYYLFHGKSVDGAMHFRTSVQAGIDIMQYMSGHTSGIALPSFVISAHEGKGKIRLITPEQLHKTAQPGVWGVTTWEGEEVHYDE